MLKYIVYLSILIFLNPCFSENEEPPSTEKNEKSVDTNGTSTHKKGMFMDTNGIQINANGLSLNKKQQIRHALNYLRTEDQIKDSIKNQKLVEGIDETLKEKEKEKVERERIKYRINKAHKSWEVVLGDPKYNVYVKAIFQEGDFILWKAQSPDPLYFAIKFKNIEMVKFFSKLEWMLDPFIKRHEYPPWGYAIMTQNMEIIRFYLDNYLDLISTFKDARGLNIFHYIFMDIERKKNEDKKDKISELLFEEKYFSRISHLLNETNGTGATVFDFILRDTMPSKPLKK